MVNITEEYLFSVGYTKTNDYTYEKIDEKTGMTVELEFNPSATYEDELRIENEIISIATRRDI